MPVKSLAVFCGSHNGKNALYMQEAVELGKLMAMQKIQLIYGGGSVGIMGTIADAVMENGGQVTGVIPKILLSWEKYHKNITELIVADDMHARKKLLYSLCDGAVILPGGHGTLDELFEMLTWNQLSIHDKRIFILNTAGFYDHLIGHITHMFEESFLYEDPRERIVVLENPEALLRYVSE
jgi:uncharacterized protein (TIGR00730 family)